MQVQLKQLLNFTAFFEEIKNEKLPLRTAYKLSQLNREIQTHEEFYREKLNAIISQYGEYDEGGEGKAYHDSSRGNIVKKSFRPGEDVDCNETHLGFVLRHEWLSYTVNIRESGKYTVRFKYGTPLSSPQELILFLDGEKIGSLQFKQTKNWSCSSEAQLSGLQLPAGKHKFSMLINGRGFNLGEISFHKE